MEDGLVWLPVILFFIFKNASVVWTERRSGTCPCSSDIYWLLWLNNWCIKLFFLVYEIVRFPCLKCYTLLKKTDALSFYESKISCLTMFSLLLKNYHPARLLTLIYMPFAVVSMAILTYYESKIDTRKRNLSGLILFFLSSLLLLLVSTTDILIWFFSIHLSLLLTNLFLNYYHFETVGFSFIR